MRPTFRGYSFPHLLGLLALFAAVVVLPDALRLHLFVHALAGAVIGGLIARAAEPHLGDRLRHSDTQAPLTLIGLTGLLVLVNSALLSQVPPLAVLFDVTTGLLLLGDVPGRWFSARLRAVRASLTRLWGRPVMPGPG